MKNPEILADMRATEETMMIFSISLNPNETPCARRLIVIHAVWNWKTVDSESIFKIEKKSGDLRINPEKWSACGIQQANSAHPDQGPSLGALSSGYALLAKTHTYEYKQLTVY